MHNPIALPKRVHTLDAFGFGGGTFSATVNDASIGQGMAFLIGELEKLDPKLREPLTSVTWQRDIAVQTGGGLVDGITAFNIDYATSGGTDESLTGNQTNNIPVMQADIGRDTYRTFIWQHLLRVPLVDQEKLQKIGRSLEDILNRGIHLAHDKEIDGNVYEGIASHKTYGLVNSPQIAVDMAAAGSGGGTEWNTKTAQEIMNDINNALVATWKSSEYDLTGMANHILIPPAQYAYLTNTMCSIGTAGLAQSVLEYLLKNNIGKNQGVDIYIYPCRWCEGAGAGSTDRMVCYANNEDRVRFSITQPLSRRLTQADVTQAAYMSLYLSQFSEVQWLYTQHAMYVDGI